MVEYYSNRQGNCNEGVFSLENQQLNEALHSKWICRFNSSSCLTFINDSCNRFFGMKPQEFLGAKKLPFVLEEDLPVLHKTLRQLNPKFSTTRLGVR